MPYIFIKSVYPSHKVDEVVKKYLEIMPKYPPDSSLGESVVSATKLVEHGVISFTAYEVKEGKFEEAMNRWMKGMGEFRNIEGYECSIEVWATAAEAFGSIGMKPPE